MTKEEYSAKPDYGYIMNPPDAKEGDEHQFLSGSWYECFHVKNNQSCCWPRRRRIDVGADWELCGWEDAITINCEGYNGITKEWVPCRCYAQFGETVSHSCQQWPNILAIRKPKVVEQSKTLCICAVHLKYDYETEKLYCSACSKEFTLPEKRPLLPKLTEDEKCDVWLKSIGISIHTEAAQWRRDGWHAAKAQVAKERQHYPSGHAVDLGKEGDEKCAIQQAVAAKTAQPSMASLAAEVTKAASQPKPMTVDEKGDL